MHEETPSAAPEPPSAPPPPRFRTSECIDWYSEGESWTVDVDGTRVTVRFIGRKGRRGRISIIGPAGAVFRTPDEQQ